MLNINRLHQLRMRHQDTLQSQVMSSHIVVFVRFVWSHIVRSHVGLLGTRYAATAIVTVNMTTTLRPLRLPIITKREEEIPETVRKREQGLASLGRGETQKSRSSCEDLKLEKVRPRATYGKMIFLHHNTWFFRTIRRPPGSHGFFALSPCALLAVVFLHYYRPSQSRFPCTITRHLTVQISALASSFTSSRPCSTTVFSHDLPHHALTSDGRCL